MLKVPSKLDRKTIEKISFCIRHGLSKAGAARAANINPRTLYNYLKAYDEGSDNPEIVELHEAVEKARSEFETECVEAIKTLGTETKSWQAYKFLLQSREPEDWNPSLLEMVDRKVGLEIANFLNHLRENLPLDLFSAVLDLTVAYPQLEGITDENNA
jgi:hypothetical protein